MTKRRSPDVTFLDLHRDSNMGLRCPFGQDSFEGLTGRQLNGGVLMGGKEKLSTKIRRNVLKIKIIIVYLQPTKMCCGA